MIEDLIKHMDIVTTKIIAENPHIESVQWEHEDIPFDELKAHHEKKEASSITLYLNESTGRFTYQYNNWSKEARYTCFFRSPKLKAHIVYEVEQEATNG